MFCDFRSRRRFKTLIVFPLLVATASAGDLAVAVKDQNGKPVEDAVVYALPVSGQAPARKGRGEVVQRNKQFVPYVSAVQAGSLVRFPNKDPVKHHVYSFSPAKKFELPLYAGTPAEPILFDQAGLVTLGCNIHDWMIAYILVVPTPWFAVTDANGEAQLRGLPAEACDVEVWQPRLKNSSDLPRQRVAGKGNASASFQLDLKPDFRLRRSPADSGDGYR
ncbi:MAG: methylamine utilization protein [Spartobacteria bacterium]